MPEGDTIHKLARSLRPQLIGRVVDEFWLRERGPVASLAGHLVCEVSVLGKHLLVGLAAPGTERPVWALHLHLGMHGRVHAHAAGERPGRPAWQATARIETPDRTLVCFRTATHELLHVAGLGDHPVLRRLGPDLLAARVPFERILHRARRREPRTAADLLLDQGVACGIGNVYKSEVLFLLGVHPEEPASRLSDETVLALYRCARRLMRRNLDGFRRTTLRRVTADTPPRAGEPRFWVYGRGGEPCLRCGAPLRAGRVGDGARATTWCPACQPRSRVAVGATADTGAAAAAASGPEPPGLRPGPG